MQNPPAPVPPLYMLESLLKAAFIVMAVPNLPYTVLVGLAASVCGLLRMLKTPQFNK